MNLLLLTSHSIAEHDDLDMFTRMGVDTFSIGAYTNPAHPSDDKRPALFDAPYHADLAEACERQRQKHAGEPTLWAIDWAKADLPSEVIDWADAIVCHHFPMQWIGGNWNRIRHKRVVWRTCGQSDPGLEARMKMYRRDGMQIVRYSPREAPAFTAAGAFAGEDAMIRFGKDPREWSGWTGEVAQVANITQDMAGRADSCGLRFYLEATNGLLAAPAGPGSEKLPGGIGALSYDTMREYLRRMRVYLYTGTRPASYTLGLIEAMMTGIPVVSIGPVAFGLPDLFEGGIGQSDSGPHLDDPAEANRLLRRHLERPPLGGASLTRQRAIDLFGLAGVMEQWRAFLGLSRVEFAHERASVTA